MIFNLDNGLRPYHREIHDLNQQLNRLRQDYQDQTDGLWDEGFRFAPIFETVMEDVKKRGDQSVLKYLQQLQARVEYWMQHFETINDPLQQLQMMVLDLKFTLKQLQWMHNRNINMMMLGIETNVITKLTAFHWADYANQFKSIVVLEADFQVQFEHHQLGQIITNSLLNLRTAFGGQVDALLKNQIKRHP